MKVAYFVTPDPGQDFLVLDGVPTGLWAEDEFAEVSYLLSSGTESFATSLQPSGKQPQYCDITGGLPHASDVVLAGVDLSLLDDLPDDPVVMEKRPEPLFPHWPEVRDQLVNQIRRMAVVYVFDKDLFVRTFLDTDAAYDIDDDVPDLLERKLVCIMEGFSRISGIVSDFMDDFHPISLECALGYYGLPNHLMAHVPQTVQNSLRALQLASSMISDLRSL